MSESSEKRPAWVLIVSVTSGLIFLITLLLIAVLIPNPTTFQIFVFRVVLSLAAAAFGAAISGFLKIKIPVLRGVISAGGALALFVLIYYVNPPALIVESTEQNQNVKIMQQLSGTVFDQKGEPLPEVSVTLTEFKVTKSTDNRGMFFFEVEAEPQARVRLMAQKNGFKTYSDDVTLGNTNLNFSMDAKSNDMED